LEIQESFDFEFSDFPIPSQLLKNAWNSASTCVGLPS
jgi:hypothetical protein